MTDNLIHSPNCPHFLLPHRPNDGTCDCKKRWYNQPEYQKAKTVHYIKVREVGCKKWLFLTSKGTSKLRIHASRFENLETAQRLIDANKDDNPEWEWKVVKGSNP